MDVHGDTNHRPAHTKPSPRRHRSGQDRSQKLPQSRSALAVLVPPLGSGLSALLLPCVAAVVSRSDWF